ncbi:MAG: trypsin-like peptidase domain-containing protein [Lentisphaerae bacterium]|nr:trypsin-like peptidase domain-containing protein [Lentisphaerota bacterium]
MKAIQNKVLVCCVAALALLPGIRDARAARGVPRNSVVRIHVTIQREDYTQPWQAHRHGKASGTGFLIKGRRILTNAHIVSDTRFIEVQKDGDPHRYVARVEFVAHDCDLATLVVDDPRFFEGTTPVKFARSLPELNDTVTVVGYPLGGDRISITEGVVSRIDYSLYAHSGVDHHLVLQVDAAINPGNSGGPVLYKGRVVGLAFQGLAWAENIGYAIPIPVLRHFLDDIEDGTYNGYPELGAAIFNTRNEALRKSLGLSDETTGVAVYYLDPFGSAVGHILPRDVLLGIDGRPIARDGTIRMNGNSILFAELLERKQWGDNASFRVLRKGQIMDIEVPLTNPHDPFAFRHTYDRKPEYFILGGLVFSPLNRGYLRRISRSSDDNTRQLVYYSGYIKEDGLYEDKQQVVVLIRRLHHPVNTYAESFMNGIVDSVNEVPIGGLQDLKRAAAVPLEGYHVIRFAGMDDSLVLDANAAAESGVDIRERYEIPANEHFEELP